MLSRIENWLLSLIQRRCAHPGNMVASDVMEGSMSPDAISYCRRCGAIKLGVGMEWRLPDPHLWRGFRADLRADVLRFLS